MVTVLPESMGQPVVGGAVDPGSVPGWDGLLGAYPGANVFHTAGWAAVLKHSYGHEPAYWVVGSAGGGGVVVPLMTARSRFTGVRGVCLPGADYCGPLLGVGGSLRPIWDRLIEHARLEGWRYVEFRGELGLEGATPSIAFQAHRLDLRSGMEAVMRGFDPAVRRAIRKAERTGVEVRVGDSAGDMDDFYGLHCRTRRRHGLPPQPKRFFEEIGEHLVRAGRGFIVLAGRPGKDAGGGAMAGAIFLHFRRGALYKFGASDLRYQEWRPNNLVMWYGIRRCLELGMEELHFGRTNIGHEGLRRFKLSWGAREEPLHYYRYGVQDGRWQSCRSLATGWHNSVFSHLPLAVNRWLGGVAYRHMD